MALTKIDDRGLKTPIDLLDDEKIRLGTGNDLDLYHTGGVNYLQTHGNSNLEIKHGSDVGIKSIADGSAELYHDGSKKFHTHSTGVTVTGYLHIEDGSTGIGLGNSDDLKLYHDGSHSYITDTGTGRLHINTSGLRVNNAADNEILISATENGSVELYHDNSKKFETTSAGAKLSGHLAINNSTQSKIVVDTADGSDDKWLNINGGGDASQSRGGGLMFGGNEYTGHEGRVWLLAGNSGNANGTIDFSTGGSLRARITNDGHFQIPNDSGKIKLGTSSDLQIYHDGSHNHIRHNVANQNLYIEGVDNEGGTPFIYLNPRRNQTGLSVKANQGVDLYYDNSKKLETTSGGINVTGQSNVNGSA